MVLKKQKIKLLKGVDEFYMISSKMYELGTRKSTIRTIFEYGRKRAAEIGEENIFDFSLGNPSIPTPNFVRDAAVEILQTYDSISVHGYTIAPGNPNVRETIAQNINKRFQTTFTAKNIFMTSGAAAAITICFKALAEVGDEFIAFAPFFPEYKCFVESVGCNLKIVKPQPKDWQINFEDLKEKLSPRTKAIIINSPNNPSGAIYSRATIVKLVKIIEKHSQAYNKTIFLICDEPYRELAYDTEVPYVTKFYRNTLVCYSYSKSFSLPGERIGYITISNEIEKFEDVFKAISGAARVLTHVNAPSLWQLVVARCVDKSVDLSDYKINGQLMYNGLVKAGFECLEPQGAFYLFPKALEEDDQAFCEYAKRYELLLVPGKDFGAPGYFRVAYCVKRETIEHSLPLFNKLVADYKERCQ